MLLHLRGQVQLKIPSSLVWLTFFLHTFVQSPIKNQVDDADVDDDKRDQQRVRPLHSRLCASQAIE